jgi:hypothetical protein
MFTAGHSVEILCPVLSAACAHDLSSGKDLKVRNRRLLSLGDRFTEHAILPLLLEGGGADRCKLCLVVEVVYYELHPTRISRRCQIGRMVHGEPCWLVGEHLVLTLDGNGGLFKN